MKKLLTQAAVLLFVACAGFAGPSLNGYSGAGVLPDTEIAETGRLELALDYYLNSGNTRKNTFPVRVNMGLAEGLEAGIGYTFQKSGELDHNAFNLNAKYAMNADRGLVTAAIGGKYSNISNLATVTNAFLAADFDIDKYISHSNEGNITLTLGTSWTDIDPKRSGDGRRGFRYYGAVKFEDGPLTLGAQYQTRLRALENKALYALHAGYDLGARFNNVTAEAGFTNAGLTMLDGTGSGRLYLGLGLSFSPRQF